MGNNQAYTDFQARVIRLYNRGILDRDLLDEMGRDYGDMDIVTQAVTLGNSRMTGRIWSRLSLASWIQPSR